MDQNKSPLNFGVVINHTGQYWMAGIRYYQNLFHSLRMADETRSLKISILYTDETDRKLLEQYFPDVSSFYEVALSSLWRSFLLRPPIRKLIARLPFYLQPETPFSTIARRSGVDILLTPSDFEFAFRVKTLYWLPDLQHLKYPGFFSLEEVNERSDFFRLVAPKVNCIVVSSQNVKSDFEAWYPDHPCLVSVQNFVAQVSPHLYERDPSWICGEYHLPERFLFLPNQFWKHKNHRVVIQALGILRNKFPDIRVVCTGSTVDYRSPNYFSELLQQVSLLGVRDQIVFLGIVSYEHLYTLMRQSVAVLQPSLFEGWSTTVEEVKTLGKKIVLSDIPVHREQDPPAAVYFDPFSPDALAEIMVQTYLSSDAGPDLDLEAQVRDQYPKRASKYGASYLELLYTIAAQKKQQTCL